MNTIRIKSITELHRMVGLAPPEHPLISVMNYADVQMPEGFTEMRAILDFYYITLKRGFKNKLQYGQQTYDFDEGLMGFMAPNQLISGGGPSPEDDLKGWIMLIHPDFIWNTSLATKIKKYEFFGYAVHEALFLSDKEETIVNGIVGAIKNEYHSNIDAFSKQIIISHIENLLSYVERFYNRQYITREKSNHQILEKLDMLLTTYFNDGDLVSRGLPTVQYISDTLHISQNYLRGLLKMYTGKNTQQHIHDMLVDRAKEKLSTTDLSVSEIAYELGFEHPQSFSKLFKKKTNMSPSEFRILYH
ncbi:helix-turn-helix domain-containing protein [Flagellimonas taeanensis]|uniref:Transcriptional regulator, AraC family n=2 Tax=Flagellimonas taeanensis TaxID=1005926 RepID=A0A1M6WYM8_9FLAO|nr:helix-turn-helix transcriptional regulator [Allomuricauda taeanensis]SHK98828.1 transcriptional regulator, AraC family [Allomuricauda taeanensis]